MNNSVAIMQPYIFPYIGYFSLLKASDSFVFYDDVNFIKKGWINRNAILINGSSYKFTIPVSNISQNRLIVDVMVHDFPYFRNEFLKKIKFAYGKAPFYARGLSYIEDVLHLDSHSISEIAERSVRKFSKIMNIERKFYRSSVSFSACRGLDKAERLIAITKELGASIYINAIGGSSLYMKPYFNEKGVSLSFLKPSLLEYSQVNSTGFVPGLSVIDLLMNCDFDRIDKMINSYVLI